MKELKLQKQTDQRDEIAYLEDVEAELRQLFEFITGPLCKMPGQMKTVLSNKLQQRRAYVIGKIEFEKNEGLSVDEKTEITRKRLNVAGILPNADSTIQTNARRSLCDLYCDKGNDCAKNVGFSVQNGEIRDCKLQREKNES